MKHMNKYILVIVFIVSLFLSIEIVNADYKATVINPAGVKCDLEYRSTGYCFFENENLNSINPLMWLDTGDEVTVITSKEKVPSTNEELCKSNYVYVSQFYSPYNNTYYGYYCEDYLYANELTDEIREQFKDSGFPESYWIKLSFLKKAHPNWNFKAINTNLNFSDAVLNETYGDNSLLRATMSNNYAYLSLNSNSFDYANDRFIPYDDVTGNDPWYLANYDAVAYYMDPRNFLTDMYIFQFETLSYDDTVSDESIKASISSLFGEGYLSNFTDDFVEAGKISLVNPIYLASLSKQEVGNGSEPGTAISGTYNGMYNFYNIGAYSGENPVYNGLNFAAKTDETVMLPWDSEYKAIVGGALWIYNSYVYHGQDTSYFKKFNVVRNYLIANGRTPTYSNYSHQYMQNITAPYVESKSTYKSYFNNDMLGLSYTFFIPVYNNMPEYTSLPTKTGWPNNYLASLTINDNPVAEFYGDVEEYNYNLDINTPILKLEASPKNNTASISGTGTFEITEDTTKTIVVTAQNGDIKNYKINVKLTGTKLEDPVDVVTTLNNAGIKNGDKYISGITIGTDIGIIKTKILNANKNAVVEMYDSSNNPKESGIVCTGDKVKVTVDTDVKEYEIVIYGDINGDGSIDSIDFATLKKNLLNQLTLSGFKQEASDVNKDGFIDSIDFAIIKKYLLGNSSIIEQ